MNQPDTRTAEERARELLAQLTLTEKVRQLGCTMTIPMLPLERQDLSGGIGAVNVVGTEHPAEDIRRIQDHIMEHSSHHIPALIHAEALSDNTVVAGGVQYPMSVGLGASFAPELVEEMAAATRQQMLRMGIRHALSPVCDLARDPRWGRCNECYGSDHTLVAAMTVAFVRGMQGQHLKDGVAACGKHFIAYSQTEAGLNMHRTMTDRRDIREQFAKPFEAAIYMAGLKTVMNAYSAIGGRPVVAGGTGLFRRGRLGLHLATAADRTGTACPHASGGRYPGFAGGFGYGIALPRLLWGLPGRSGAGR